MPDIARLLEEHGLGLVFANVLLEQVGLPLPAVPTLMLAGALASEGKLSGTAVFAAAFAASLIGDTLWFVAGRRYGSRVLKLLCRISLSPDSCVRQTEYRFERWGVLTVVLGKFIPGLSTVAPPLAGAMRYSWLSFLALNALGIAIWALAALGGGMLFHAEIARAVAVLADVGAVGLYFVAALLAAYIALKWWERRRFYKMLRVARVSAEQLRRLFDGEKKPVVVDLRSRAARRLDRRFIPGALEMDLPEVSARLGELLPDRDIVFYCNCPNEASAAAAARQLIDLGYTRVRPLQGGLDAWIAAGYDIEQRPALART